MIKRIWSWTCNQKKFFSKIEAIKESSLTNQPINFNTPTTYDSFLWFQEPTQSWENILKERALEIRQNSKYINILFSGGCDSTKVIETFVKNNVPIDEITCLRIMPPNNTDFDADYEVNSVAIPYLKKIKKHITKTKISMFDLTFNDYKSYYNNQYWIEKGYSTPNELHFRMTHQAMNTFFKIHDNSNSTILLGRDKPTLFYKNKKWYSYFLDVDIEPRTEITLSNCVYFYADSPKVHAKQSHMLKQYLEKNFLENQYETPDAINAISQKHINVGCGRINSINDFFIEKVRNTWNFHDNKIGKILIHGKKDFLAINSILKDNDYNDLIHNWRVGLDNIKINFGTKWFNKGDPALGTVGVYSKFYCLNEPDIKTIDDLFPGGFQSHRFKV